MNPTPTPARLILRLLAVVLGSSAVLAVPSVVLNLMDRGCAADEMLSPAWLETRDASLWFPLLAVGAGGFWLWRETFPSLGETLRPKVAAVALGVLLQLVSFFGVLVLFLSLHRNWLYPPPRPSLSRLSADGKRTAHVLYQCTPDCLWEAYVQEGNSWKMKRTDQVSGDVTEVIEWDGQGLPHLVRNANPSGVAAGTPSYNPSPPLPPTKPAAPPAPPAPPQKP